MVHFCTIVCLPPTAPAKVPAAVTAVLAPYDENLRVAPYRRYETGDPAAFWNLERLRTEAGLNPDDATVTWEQIAAAGNRLLPDETPYVVDEKGMYWLSTANPKGRWDWWGIGGRFSDHFDGPPYGTKAALDPDRHRRRHREEAAAANDRFLAFVAAHPPATPYSEFHARIDEAAGYTFDDARADYAVQPLVQAMRASEEWPGYPVPGPEWPDRERAGEDAAAEVFAGLAQVHLDGSWDEPAHLEGWVLSDEDRAAVARYTVRANAYVDALPDDAVIVVVDCHT